MRLTISLLLLAFGLVAAGCSTDDMVPKAPVGQEKRLSQPPESIMPRTATQPVETASLDRRGPQNTLEAQADALAATGENPVASGPAPGEQPAESQDVAANPTIAKQAPAAVAARGTIRFMPIIGAPVAAVTPLSRQLGSEARANGLTIKSSADPTAEHILKGYLSAFNDGQKTTIVYVWDVLDNSGQRLNRIQGQEEVAGRAGDAWSSVPEATMRQIATKTIGQYLAWKGGA